MGSRKPLKFHPALQPKVYLGTKVVTRRLPGPEQLESIHWFAGEPGAQDGDPELAISWGEVIDDDGRVTQQWRVYDGDYPDEGVIGLGPLYGAPGETINLLGRDGRPFSRTVITGVSLERIQDITDEEVLQEGVEPYAGGLRWVKYVEPVTGGLFNTPRDAFASHWDLLYGDGSWACNEWVFVVSYGAVVTAEATPS